MMLRKPTLVVRKLSVFFLVGIVLGVMVVAASAAELPAGTVINKANLDKIMNDTFEGKTIQTLLTKVMEYQIRDWGLQMKLGHSTPIPKFSAAYLEATNKYARDVKFDPQTREVTGWKAGLPFPDVSPDDPYAGDKLIWNYYYGNIQGRSQYSDGGVFFLLINPNTGLERRQRWSWNRYYMKGRLDGPGKPPVIGDGSILSKTLFFATFPNDIRGVGIFTIRWDSPKLEDTWAYIKSVRRTRRLSGGAWADPVDGLDTLADELWVLNSRPSWYKSWKLLSKRWILAIANDKLDYVKGAPTVDMEFPSLDFKNWPRWNPSLANVWEPREVYVIEGITPSYHPHSKRVIYMDVHLPVPYEGEGYDKAGNIWKLIRFTYYPNNKKTADYSRCFPPSDYEGTTMIPPEGYNVDFKRRHSTVFYIGSLNSNPKVGPDDVTLGQLEGAGR